MRLGNKENAMTVTLSKRCFEDAAALAPSQTSKKLRVLGPLAEQLPAGLHVKPGVGSLQPQHLSSGRKRRLDTHAAPGSNNGLASPSTGGKRGRRADGRPSTAAASPGSARTALEALLTCEGLERDADLEAEVAYLTARHSTTGAAEGNTVGAASGGSNRDSPRHTRASAAAAAAAAAQGSSSPRAVQDAAHSSRQKRRDQDQLGGRSRRSSGGGSNGGSRDQAASREAPASPAHPAATAPAGQADAAAEQADTGPTAGPAPEQQIESERVVSLDIHSDKEWERLFAVLTISGAASERRASNGSGSSGGASTAAAAPQPAAAGAGAAVARCGTASHRLVCSVNTTAAAATAGPTQEAPQTPVRVEACSGGSSSSGGFDCTPRRSSFLACEFSRVQLQQQRINTPPPPQQQGLAAAAARPMRVVGHVPCMLADCEMDV